MVHFLNKNGTKIAAHLVLSKSGQKASPVALFSHALYGSKQDTIDSLIGQRLSEEGISSLYIDFSGHGASGGRIDENIVAQQREDLESACDFLCAQPEIDINRIGLSGSSFGSRAAIQMAAHNLRVKALVLRAPVIELSITPEVQHISANTMILVGENDRWFSAGKCSLKDFSAPKNLS